MQPPASSLQPLTRLASLIVMTALLGFTIGAAGQDMPLLPLPEGLTVLCYHDVPKVLDQDKFGVDQATFVETIEYLRTHGYQFVSFDDLLAVHEGKQALPPRALLLTFDDSYKSFHDFVFPLLKQYRYPAVLAVVSSWIDQPPPDVKQPLMSWEELREVAESSLVEIASHTHDLHRGITYNPQGNQGAASVQRLYDAAAGTYETDEAYRARIRDDLAAARRTLETRLGKPARLLVWPYGKYNAVTLEEAHRAGFAYTFALNDQMASLADLSAVSRVMIYKNPTVQEFAKDLRQRFTPPIYRRILQADLDLIYDSDPAQTEENLGRFLDRVVAMKVNTVFLQAFADPEGNGNIRSVYFPNRVLPMRADLFTRVAHQLKSREIEVFAWMPMLSIVPPDEEEREALRVREATGAVLRPSLSWYERLSPFSRRTRQLLRMLYEDMAVHAWVDGVVFQDDGYLTDDEDFHPDAIPLFDTVTRGALRKPEELTAGQRKAWTALKTQTLIDLSLELAAAVHRERPEAKIARTLYAPVVTQPESEEWFAQSYAKSLAAYDYIVIMAYPRLEEIHRVEPWLKALVDAAKRQPDGIEKTIFKVQAYDWKREAWIPTRAVTQWLRRLTASGARHLAYYPDDYVDDQPEQQTVRLMMSAEDFPFERR